MASDSPLVGIIMGSQSDLDVMRNASETLDDLGISNEMKSCRRTATPNGSTNMPPPRATGD